MQSPANALPKLSVLVLCLIGAGCATFDHRAYAPDGALIVAGAVVESTDDLVNCGPLSFKRLKEQQAKGCYLYW